MNRQPLPFGPLGREAVHLCIDMQRLFGEATEWHTPGVVDVTPAIVRISSKAPDRNIFTRFRAPLQIEHAKGQWQTYYQRWHSVLADRNDEDLYDLVPELRRFVPPGQVLDKLGYSAFDAPSLEPMLQELKAATLILTGVETDVCVLSTLFGAIDRGYRIILVADAIASSDPASHEATLAHVIPRFDRQVEVTDTASLVEHWHP
ncbi:MAG: isochorismatase family cysteine hydrolase [Hyphomicrobiaceae bacterium]